MSPVAEHVLARSGTAGQARIAPVEGPGWPEPRSYPVRECLLVILNEEREHRFNAERDPGRLGSPP
jgi:hypothetical protein